MQNISKFLLIIPTMVLVIACGKGAKEEKGALGDMKVKLESLKKQKTDIEVQIRDMENEIARLDPEAAKTKAKLVGIATIGTDSFSHYIDLQGKIDAENVAYVAPRGPGGVVKAIYVKTGNRVRQGQLVIKLDDALARQGVVAAQQQIGGIKAQLEQAQSIYQRQQNLWRQNIGTEVQVLNAKTNVEALQSQLRAAEANVRLAQEQVNLSNVYAGISGVVDEMNVKIGEFFSPQTAAMPGSGIRIVNSNNLKVEVKVPENYISRINEGTELIVTLPEANKTITTKVTVVGKLIDPNSRSFTVEGRLPANKDFRPNQIALVRIRDYTTTDAITIPVNTLQNDENGKYVMVAVTENGKQVARKKMIIVGELYGDQLEVRSGLQKGDLLITEGYQGLYEGQVVTTVVQ